MILSQRWKAPISALLMASLLAACGAGSDSGNGSGNGNGNGNTTCETSNSIRAAAIADDGFDWINYRRTQIGLAALTRNDLINIAAQHHSEYQKFNHIISHDEISGKCGFTGTNLLERLKAVAYVFNPSLPYVYGEVISATSDSSGASMVEQLIAAIYHRFVMFEPMFKEIGTGAASTSTGYTYFTSDFTANNGYGQGIGLGQIANYPFADQTAVPTNFFSDNEEPDPVPDQNEVGYPISVHTNISGNLTVQSFTVRPRGGSDLPVRLLTGANDGPRTPASAAAIIPLSVLSAQTIHDVSFTGQVDGISVTRDWSFTTK